MHLQLNQQKDKVQVITRENIELAQTLEKRNIDLELHIEKEAKQEYDIKQRDDVIKVLSQKEEEQANIIKLLRNNLENRSVVDSNVNFFFYFFNARNASINFGSKSIVKSL